MDKDPYQKFGEAEDVSVDGEAVDLREATFATSGYVNTSLDDTSGYTRRKEGGFLKGKMYLSAGMSASGWQGKRDFTLFWKADTGQTYTAAHAWVEGKPEVSKDGFDIEFRFNKCSEVTNG